MSANGPKDQVAWDLDWDDLTEGAATPTPAQPITLQATPPPLPRRAFPTPAATFPVSDPVPIVPVQHLPTSVQITSATPSATAPIAGPKRTLIRGQRVKLAEILPGNPPPAFEAVFTLTPAAGQSLDLCCFGLDENSKLLDDRYFIFYNQKTSPDGALTIRGTRGEIFGVDLGRLPGTVRRLVFTATVDGTGTVRALGASRFELRGTNATQAVTRYEFTGNELDEVQALMVAEIYVKDGVWRLSAVGQGFAGGLSEVLRHFGGQEI